MKWSSNGLQDGGYKLIILGVNWSLTFTDNIKQLTGKNACPVLDCGKVCCGTKYLVDYNIMEMNYCPTCRCGANASKLLSWVVWVICISISIFFSIISDLKFSLNYLIFYFLLVDKTNKEDLMAYKSLVRPLKDVLKNLGMFYTPNFTFKNSFHNFILIRLTL